MSRSTCAPGPGLQTRGELIKHEWLREILVCAALEGSDSVLGPILAADDDEQRPVDPFAQMPERPWERRPDQDSVQDYDRLLVRIEGKLVRVEHSAPLDVVTLLAQARNERLAGIGIGMKEDHMHRTPPLVLCTRDGTLLIHAPKIR
ncbi:MAG TPA: hypothetical protein VEV18_02500 [Steroidobacteraceae bacterium]|nr:hypothetical protein [Steroidobacteraceae bacterium]